MLLAIAVFPLLLVVAGCASYDGYTLKPGQATNIEVDVIGKYLVRSLALRGTT